MGSDTCDVCDAPATALVIYAGTGLSTCSNCTEDLTAKAPVQPSAVTEVFGTLLGVSLVAGIALAVPWLIIPGFIAVAAIGSLRAQQDLDS